MKERKEPSATSWRDLQFRRLDEKSESGRKTEGN